MTAINQNSDERFESWFKSCADKAEHVYVKMTPETQALIWYTMKLSWDAAVRFYAPQIQKLEEELRQAKLDAMPDWEKMYRDREAELTSLKQAINRKDEQLGQASGALSYIQSLSTSSVKKEWPEEVKRVFQVILNRILSSAHKVHLEPRWYIHDYEREEWEKYLSGQTKACASDKPSKDVAAALSGTEAKENE